MTEVSRLRRRMLLVPAAVLGLLAFLPPVGAQEEGAPEAVAATFPGFNAVDSYAQGQMATGYFFAVGDEENRLVGALSVINGPPAGSGNVAAFVQRGVAASYTYGLVGGGGPGQAGALPQPPPGEAGAFYPAEPQEATWQGPVTAGANGPVVDGRFRARATPTPTGRADAAISAVEVPGQLKVEQAVVLSHTEPAEGGVAAESISVVRGVTIGPLHIESLVSRATGFVSSAPGEPKGTATTVLEGVTVNGTGVQVTDKGVVVGEQASPGAQEQVNNALTQAGFSEVRLTASSATAGDNSESVRAVAGVLRVVHRDQEFGASNPQGFSGGGFSVGGAEVRVLGRRCAPTCPGSEGAGIGIEPGLTPVDQPAPSLEAAPPPEVAVAAAAAPFEDIPSAGGAGSSYTSSSFQPAEGSSYTTATTPSSPTAPVEPSSAATQAAGPQQLAISTLGAREANWARDAYLALAAALLGVLVLATRFAGARAPLRR